MSDQGAELFVDGVTAERVAELHRLAKVMDPDALLAGALRDAMHFYELTRKAWQGCREEYDELREELQKERDRRVEHVQQNKTLNAAVQALQRERNQYRGKAAGAEREVAIVRDQLEATQTELERRTAWSNEELAKAREEQAKFREDFGRLAIERDEWAVKLRPFELVKHIVASTVLGNPANDEVRAMAFTAIERVIAGSDAECECTGCAELREDVQRLKDKLAEAEQNELDQSEQVAELKADLRRFEPSDGMMYRLLEYTTRLQEADDLLTDLRPWVAKSFGDGLLEVMARVDAWHQRHLAGEGAKLAVTRWYQVIVDAAELLTQAQNTVIHAPWPEITEWLARPVVALARKGTR